MGEASPTTTAAWVSEAREEEELRLSSTPAGGVICHTRPGSAVTISTPAMSAHAPSRRPRTRSANRASGSGRERARSAGSALSAKRRLGSANSRGADSGFWSLSKGSCLHERAFKFVS